MSHQVVCAFEFTICNFPVFYTPHALSLFRRTLYSSLHYSPRHTYYTDTFYTRKYPSTQFNRHGHQVVSSSQKEELQGQYYWVNLTCVAATVLYNDDSGLHPYMVDGKVYGVPEDICVQYDGTFSDADQGCTPPPELLTELHELLGGDKDLKDGKMYGVSKDLCEAINGIWTSADSGCVSPPEFINALPDISRRSISARAEEYIRDRPHMMIACVIMMVTFLCITIFSIAISVSNKLCALRARRDLESAIPEKNDSVKVSSEVIDDDGFKEAQPIDQTKN
ncbi:hypothetical protein CC80DRAFT_535739 [Byssothecium circinans]|uniref:Uncharacterized protein n=1 Tax=Byssothecium circinans TaxID=147558 RepID=A0A6A5TU03_9PLEO|nr:hypothetical protein CC80DRAFT_535739 [Byssothecium circinans]